MPPRKDTPEILEQLRILTEKVESVAKKQDEIATLTLEVRRLREENACKQKKIDTMENRIDSLENKIDSLENKLDSLEQYSKRDNVIISGLRVNHKSYARAAVQNDDQKGESAPSDELNTLEDKVVEFLESKKITVNKQTISGCHVIGKGHNTQPPKIIVRFVNRKEKTNLLKQGKKLKGTNVYINEHLTKKNAQIAKHARELRKIKDGDVVDTWSRQCTVFIKMKDDSIKKVTRLEDFVELGLPSLAPETG